MDFYVHVKLLHMIKVNYDGWEKTLQIPDLKFEKRRTSHARSPCAQSSNDYNSLYIWHHSHTKNNSVWVQTNIHRLASNEQTPETQPKKHSTVLTILFSLLIQDLCFILKDRQYSSTSVKCFLISFKMHQTLHTLSELSDTDFLSICGYDCEGPTGCLWLESL